MVRTKQSKTVPRTPTASIKTRKKSAKKTPKTFKKNTNTSKYNSSGKRKKRKSKFKKKKRRTVGAAKKLKLWDQSNMTAAKRKDEIKAASRVKQQTKRDDEKKERIIR